MKKLLSILIIGAAVSLVSCSGGKKVDGAEAPVEVEEQKSLLEQALSAGNLKQASVMADSMSLFVDDFTPEQTVQVLTAFVRLHTDAASRRESRRDLETLRKYVDVYDIALSVNPKATRAAFDKAKRENPDMDFDALAIEFRKKLNQYDSMQDGSLVKAAAEPDSVKADSTERKPAELPLELRPAE